MHRKASIFLTLAFLFTTVAQLNLSNLLFCIGSLIGVIATPDWDVDNGFIGDQMIRDRIGSWAEKLWKMLLYWYRRSLKHGSPISHFPIISTYGRILYLFVILILIPHSVFYIIFHPSWDLTTVLFWYWNIINSQPKIIEGLIASDIIHFTLDILTTEHKQKGTRL